MTQPASWSRERKSSDRDLSDSDLAIGDQQIVLASRSPRRRELLDQMGITYRLVDPEVDESPVGSEAPAEYVTRLARSKAAAGARLESRGRIGAPGSIVLGADTVVVLDGQVLGKPRDSADSARMIANLSGRWHQVLSAVALTDGSRISSRVSTTDVQFRELSIQEQAAYVATQEGRDKAGAYGIQGYGGVLVARIQGSYSGVVGLPVAETEELLGEFGIDSWRFRSVD